MANKHVLIKPASGLCNLRCKYCFYSDEAKNRSTASYGMMSEETLENIIKKTIQSSDTACTIAYQGGEPTLRGIDFFKRSIEIQSQYNTKSIKIHNSIQTNGVNLSDEWLEFFAKNQFLVGISLDGVAYTHDLYRVDEAGKGSFNKVKQTIERMKEKGVAFNILTVVNAQTAKKVKEIYHFYKEQNLEYIQFIPCLNPIGKEKVRYEYTLTSKLYSSFLRTLFDLWYQDTQEGNWIHIEQFENYILMLLGRPPEICGMSGVCSYQNVIEADGGVYPCDFYALDEYLLGSLNQNSFKELDQKRREIQFIEQSMPLDEKCRQCRFLKLCYGGCRRHRESLGENFKNPNLFCKAYEEFFEYTIDRFRELAQRF